jgi:hypothetical protein
MPDKVKVDQFSELVDTFSTRVLGEQLQFIN